jgi:hypothetical protein
MRKVQLIPAYGWKCVSCGEDNFIIAFPAEITEEEKRDMLSEIRGVELDEFDSLDEIRDGEWTKVPEDVTCKNCQRNFAVDLDEFQ